MFKKFNLIYNVCIIGLCSFFFVSCTSTKYVPEGEYLLSNAKVKSDIKEISGTDLDVYIKQKPNFKTFTIFKLPLTIYNLSGRDTTKWLNRVLRNAGDPPVIYDSTMVKRTVIDLKRMMTNKGYLDAQIEANIKRQNKKAEITYNITAGNPFKINEYKISVNDLVLTNPKVISMPRRFLRSNKMDSYISNIDSLLQHNTIVKKNENFDLNILDSERDRITSFLRRIGYYGFNKEHIGFVADTTVGNKKVDLELSLYPASQRGLSGRTNEVPHKQYIVKEVNMYIDYNPVIDGDTKGYKTSSVYEKDGYYIYYGERGEYIKPEVLLNNCYITPGGLYNESMTALTYSSLSQLRMLRNINISFTNDSTDLRCIITCVPDKKQGLSTEIDGTNSGGNFGVGASIGYSHRNAFKGSELFNIRAKTAYESMTPNFTDFENNYIEVGGETSLTFPRFMFPFLKRDFKRQIHASTQFTADYTYQRRPKYFARTILSSGVKYIWQDRRRPLTRHSFNLIDVSYVYIPEDELKDEFKIHLTEAAKRYSFTSQLIVGSSYSFSTTNLGNANEKLRRPIYSLRGSVESTGNLLALASKLANIQPDSIGAPKKVFGTAFAQYIRGSIDYSYTIFFDDKNSFAWHLGGGVAFPYGNYKEIPIQKRFFSGGANSVRGWSVRELGPGSFYPTSDNFDNFYYHSGDIRFDANLEYRSKIFWVVELAAFLDAGNIWLVNKTKDVEGGNFAFDRFYKEIAVSWGLGLRFDFDYVLIRLDAGWKAYDPSNEPGKTKWPIKDPLNLRKNASAHIAVGYPF